MRYNIFNNAHLPLKTALISSCIALTEALDENTSSALVALEKVEEVLEVYKEQTTYESLHILPCVFEYEPSIWNNYMSEHAKGSEISKLLKRMIRNYHQQLKAGDKMKILRGISECFNEFVQFNFVHMDDEEAVLNEILWRYYKDHILRQLEEKMDILPHKVSHKVQTKELQIATAA